MEGEGGRRVATRRRPIEGATVDNLSEGQLLKYLSKEMAKVLPKNLLWKVNRLASDPKQFSEKLSKEVSNGVQRRLVRCGVQEEKRLGKIVDNVASSLAKVNEEIVRKEEKIERLSRKIAEIQRIKECPRRGKRRGKRGGRKKKKNDKRNDGLLASDIFPEEVWKLIFDKMYNGKDLRSCSNACQLFQRILHPRRAELLFEQVMPVLYKSMEKKEILQCRLVCRAWNFGVDEFFENYPSLAPYDDTLNPTEPIIDVPRLTKYQFVNTREGTTGFMEKMWDHPRNPFIGRTVSIYEFDEDYPNDITPAEFWNSLYVFLEHFGKHIWHLNFCTSRKFTEGRDVARLLTLDIFEHIPNLKKLWVGGELTRQEDQHLFFTSSSDAVASTVLNTLQIDDCEYFSSMRIPDMLVANHHDKIRRLHIDITQWRVVSFLDWIELRELHVEHIRADEEIYALKVMKTPNLTKLGIAFHSGRIFGSWENTNCPWTEEKTLKDPLKALLEVLRKLCATTNLSFLRLSGSLIFRDQNIRRVKSSLWETKLKTIEIEHFCLDYADTNYQFLLHFPFLESLHVFLRRRVDDMDTDPPPIPCGWGTSEIEFIDDWRINTTYKSSTFCDGFRLESVLRVWENVDHRTMHRTRLWQFLPKLKVISLQGKVSTRAEHDLDFGRQTPEDRIKLLLN